MELKILYEDNDIIVVVKPPKVPSQPDKTGDEDMLSCIIKHSKTAEIGLIHRLDRPVGGIMVFGKTKKSTDILNKCVADKTIEKTYYAVVCGDMKNKTGVLEDYLLKNQKLNLSKVVQKGTPNAKYALLEYEVISKIYDEKYKELNLVKISLKTGRHHQIRVQFSNNNTPLWGDNKYNDEFKRSRGWTQIALWSGGLKFNHPITKKEMDFEIKPEGEIFEKFYFNCG